MLWAAKLSKVSASMAARLNVGIMTLMAGDLLFILRLTTFTFALQFLYRLI